MLTYFVLSFLIFCLSYAQKEEKDWTKLTLSTGPIRGRKFVTDQKNTAYLFHGIPYAEAPIGDLRFRAPIDKKPWKDELSTKTYKVVCMNPRPIDFSLSSARNMSEDCLHVNVFTTEKCLTEKNCPVMHYIFGGKWINGSPFIFEDDMIIDNFQSRDIVLVTSNFRLGVFGLINTGKITSAVKNLEMLDMIHGLKWTQREIGVFGGDKNKVTLYGHSSGACAVDLLSLSPLTAGLFHQIVLMSGPAGMFNWRAEQNLDQSRSLAVMSGCATEDEWDAGNSFEAILNCLRKKTATELMDIQRIQEKNGDAFYGPAIDGEGGVLPENLAALLRKRRPYRQMVGTTSREFRVSKVIVDKEGNINQPLLSALCVLSAKSRGFKHLVAVGRACAEEYSKRPYEIADLSDDIEMYVPTFDSSSSMRLNGATVYQYSFEYAEINDASNEKSKKGVGIESPFHAEDLVYIMGLSFNKFTEKDRKIQQIYSGMFADFIKKGDPSPPNGDKWQPTDDRNNYFKIDFDKNMNMPGNTNGYHVNAIKFWTKTAPELDRSYSTWANDTFDMKKITPNVIKGLKDLGDTNGGEQMKGEIEVWEKELENLNRNGFNDDSKENVNNDEKEEEQKSIVNQGGQMTGQFQPSVRDETMDGRKNFDWQLWFWVTAGVAVLLAAILLLMCCCSCYQNSKRKEFETPSETTSLSPSSSKTYS